MPRSTTSHRAASTRNTATGAERAKPRRPRATGQAAHQVRIIGGDWKRTPLAVIDAEGLRPTPDRVRETLFNWLATEINGARCLDLFAGTGALGFEAASRGAARVLMIERNPRAAMQLKAMKAKLSTQKVEIAEADALRLGNNLEAASFDFVFLDPPFDSNLLAKALPIAARLCTPYGAIYVESSVALQVEAIAEGEKPGKGAKPGDEIIDPALLAAWEGLRTAGWQITRQGRAGAVHYHLLRRETDE